MGRNLKPADEIQGHRTPTQILARKQKEEALHNMPELTSKAPAWLDERAQAEWLRVVPLLVANIPVSELDSTLVASYCQAVSTIATAQEHINHDGYMTPAERGGEKVNPYVAIKTNATKEMMKLADALGLSIYGRLKLNVKGADVGINDPFADLLA
jgi:P27 family predicted phage terminase small subunit